MNNLWFRNP